MLMFCRACVIIFVPVAIVDPSLAYAVIVICAGYWFIFSSNSIAQPIVDTGAENSNVIVLAISALSFDATPLHQPTYCPSKLSFGISIVPSRTHRFNSSPANFPDMVSLSLIVSAALVPGAESDAEAVPFFFADGSTM